MKKEQITIAEWDGVRDTQKDSNIALLHEAETQPLRLSFSSSTKALYKVTALYAIRKRLNAQVRMMKQGAVIVLGPGVYPEPLLTV